MNTGENTKQPREVLFRTKEKTKEKAVFLTGGGADPWRNGKLRLKVYYRTSTGR